MKKPLALLCFAALTLPFGFAQQNQQNQPQLTTASAGAPVLPSGTPIHMKLETGLSTAVNKVGDTFTGRVTADVQNSGSVVIPVGSQITGKVTRSKEQRMYKGRPVLELRPEEVILPSGQRYQISAVLIATDRQSGTSVDSEGQIKANNLDRRDKMEMAAGTGAGALAGGVIARSGKGTLVGAMVGGGAAVAYWLSKTKSASLTAGTEIVMELARPMTMTAAGD